jgi:hypothetical protein
MRERVKNACRMAVKKEEEEGKGDSQSGTQLSSICIGGKIGPLAFNEVSV